MGLYQQRHCQFELRWTEIKWLLDLLGSTGTEEGAIQQGAGVILQQKGRLTPKATEIIRATTPTPSPGATSGFQRPGASLGS